MLCALSCAFCACAAQNPNVKNATEMKIVSLFMGDFTIDVQCLMGMVASLFFGPRIIAARDSIACGPSSLLFRALLPALSGS
jgi:hypothetical protein